MRISFALGFILLIAGAAGIAGYLGMGKTETVCVVGLVVLMRIAVSLEELVVEARATNPSRTLRNLMSVMVQQEEKRRGS